jgi:RimJ/RimL family protein N-acetyltransferase
VAGIEVMETDRLVIRRLRDADAPFIVSLLNDADFLRYIGDRGVRGEADAVRYIAQGPPSTHERLGFGMDVVTLRATGEPLGICGLLKREVLDHPDIGFAFLPAARRRGYAHESASAVLAHARARLGLRRILAITSLENAASIALLGKLGFVFQKVTRLGGSADQVRLFASDPA